MTPSAQEVEVYADPWVSGTRVAEFFGPITAQVTYDDGDYESASEELHQIIRNKASALGANAVVGFGIEVDPFTEKGIQLSGLGTAAMLEPLF